MRVISQDGKCDYPYENSTLFIDYMDGCVIRLLTLASDDIGVKLAVYSTEEKAKKAMEMLRSHYDLIQKLRWGNDKSVVNNFISELDKNLSKAMSEYFQFPKDEEIEV